MPPQAAPQPGQTVRLGHGDAMHVTDIDPNRPGLEIFTVHEGGTFAPYGYALRDAATGEVLFGDYTGRDTGPRHDRRRRPDGARASRPGRACRRLEAAA